MSSGSARVIGVTGGVASGKSSVCRVCERRGLPVIDADQVSRCIMRPGHPAMDQVIAEFGREILDDDGALDRERLGAIVFGDSRARRRLEDIVHPPIIGKIKQEVNALMRRGAQYVIMEVPLLYETGMETLCDEVWVVWCDRDEQVRRLVKREGLSPAEAGLRIEAQMPLAEKVRRADRVIDNNGTISELRCRVHHLLDALLTSDRRDSGVSKDY